jgi:hypothetical protein
MTMEGHQEYLTSMEELKKGNLEYTYRVKNV